MQALDLGSDIWIFLHDCDDRKHMIVEQNRFLVSSITNRRFSLHAIEKWNIKTVQYKSSESGNEEENMQRPLPRLRSGPAYARYSEKWFFLIYRALYEGAMLVPIGMDTNVAAGNFLLRKLEFISRENHENHERFESIITSRYLNKFSFKGLRGR